MVHGTLYLQKPEKHLKMKWQICVNQQRQQDMRIVLHGAGKKQYAAMHLKNKGGHNGQR